MTRAFLSFIAFAVILIFVVLVGCKKTVLPDEQQFRQILVQLLVDGAKRTEGKVDGEDPVKVIVFDPSSIPANFSELSELIKQGLTNSDIAWIDADLQSYVENLPGEWITLRESDTLQYNRTHAMLKLSILGEGKERMVEWIYICGTLCGYGEGVRFQWSGRNWEYETIAYIRK